MQAVWNLIGCLKTSPQLYLSLLKNERLEERLGRPRQTSNYRLLYTLQIIFNFMAYYRKKELSMAFLYYEAPRRPQPLWGNANVSNYDKEFPSFEEHKTNG